MDTKEIVTAILAADETDLAVIENALRVRRKTLNEMRRVENEAVLYVGDQVVVRDSVTPKKIAGKVGYIMELRNRKGANEYLIKLTAPPDHRWNTFWAQAESINRIGGKR